MLIFVLAVLVLALVMYVIVEALFSSPDAQGTPRHHYINEKTGEEWDETLGQYVSRSANSGCAFFGPLVLALLAAILLFMYISSLAEY